MIFVQTIPDFHTKNKLFIDDISQILVLSTILRRVFTKTKHLYKKSLHKRAVGAHLGPGQGGVGLKNRKIPGGHLNNGDTSFNIF